MSISPRPAQTSLLSPTRALFTALVLSLLPACFGPDFDSGTLRCGEAECPEDMTCAEDGYCYHPGEGPLGQPDADLSGDDEPAEEKMALGGVDQFNLVALEGSSGLNSLNEREQTFVLSQSGCLTAIELSVLQCGGTEADSLTLEVYEGQSNTAVSLGSATLQGALNITENTLAIPISTEASCPGAPSLKPDLISSTVFDLRSDHIRVVAGQPYAFAMRAITPDSYYHLGNNDHGYAGGEPLVNWAAVNTPPFEYDQIFKIFINTSAAECL